MLKEKVKLEMPLNPCFVLLVPKTNGDRSSGSLLGIQPRHRCEPTERSRGCNGTSEYLQVAHSTWFVKVTASRDAIHVVGQDVVSVGHKLLSPAFRYWVGVLQSLEAQCQMFPEQTSRVVRQPQSPVAAITNGILSTASA